MLGRATIRLGIGPHSSFMYHVGLCDFPWSAVVDDALMR